MTSGTVGRAREFWWDELEKIFLQPGRLPRSLRLRIDSHDHQWELDSTADYTEAVFRLHCGWHADNEKPPTARQRIYISLYYELQQMPRETRDPIIDEIVDWAGASRAVRPRYRALSPKETQSLPQAAGSPSARTPSRTNPSRVSPPKSSELRLREARHNSNSF